jgi:hypothetical protein
VDEREELRQLRAEVATLRIEHDVLKRFGGPLGEGGDEMTVARFVADHRTLYQSRWTRAWSI